MLAFITNFYKIRFQTKLRKTAFLYKHLTFQVILHHAKKSRLHNVGIRINFHQNRFIDECAMKNFLKIT